MLIIFDLDDTLVDTYRCLTIPKLKETLIHMVQGGLKLDCSFEHAFNELVTCTRSAPSGREALISFLPDFKNGADFLESSTNYLYESSDEGLDLAPVEGALQALNQLKENHTLCLVSAGFEGRQKRKLEKAGIDSGIFGRIEVTQARRKGDIYLRLMEELGFSPKQTIVCGDKFDVDIEPAVRLGCFTAHAEFSPRRCIKRSGLEADISVTTFNQLLDFIETFENNEEKADSPHQ